MKLSKVIIISLLSAGFISVSAQNGADHVSSFLNLPVSSRISGLGGSAIAINDKDNANALVNPSLNGLDNDNMLTMSFIDYFGDVASGSFAYSKTFDKLGSYNIGVQYLSYGKIKETDVTGAVLGDFTAKDYAITLGWGRKLSNNFLIGSNIKQVISNYHQYSAYAIALDVAGAYVSDDDGFAGTLVFKNMGRQITTFDGTRQTIPFEIVAGISKKFKHVPLRYLITYTHLEEFDLTYNEPPSKTKLNLSQTDDSDAKDSKVQDFADKFMRHIIVGAEFMPSKNLCLRLGYNYKRRQELKVDTKLALVGFSGGLEVRVSKFRVGYSRASYHLAGALNQFTLSTNFSDFAKPKPAIM